MKECAFCTVPMGSKVRFNGRDRITHFGNFRDTICILCEEIIGDKHFKSDKEAAVYCINVLHDSDFYVIDNADKRRGPPQRGFVQCRVCESIVMGTSSKLYCSDKCRNEFHSVESLRQENEKLKTQVESLINELLALKSTIL
jgi:hypothetical protein